MLKCKKTQKGQELKAFPIQEKHKAHKVQIWIAFPINRKCEVQNLKGPKRRLQNSQNNIIQSEKIQGPQGSHVTIYKLGNLRESKSLQSVHTARILK